MRGHASQVSFSRNLLLGKVLPQRVSNTSFLSSYFIKHTFPKDFLLEAKHYSELGIDDTPLPLGTLEALQEPVGKCQESEE